ncbi:hypothetical protein PIB30_052557 [Stylosanthes scabra]|uniref:Uncharacterized protein n=1 Tax=Stylosanthes scabra TaxID=79078 RepID=A0ABU6VJW7_9FABA|nr:hypothetical protein [Stylosanthes scabra]
MTKNETLVSSPPNDPLATPISSNLKSLDLSPLCSLLESVNHSSTASTRHRTSSQSSLRLRPSHRIANTDTITAASRNRNALFKSSLRRRRHQFTVNRPSSPFLRRGLCLHHLLRLRSLLSAFFTTSSPPFILHLTATVLLVSAAISVVAASSGGVPRPTPSTCRGECIITLEDVANQLGLSIDGHPVNGYLSDFPQLMSRVGRPAWEWFTEIFSQLLPHVAVDKMIVRFSWFIENFTMLPPNTSKDIVVKHARAYIVMLLSTQRSLSEIRRRREYSFAGYLICCKVGGPWQLGACCVSYRVGYFGVFPLWDCTDLILFVAIGIQLDRLQWQLLDDMMGNEYVPDGVSRRTCRMPEGRVGDVVEREVEEDMERVEGMEEIPVQYILYFNI